jgi:catechol 2,3-dioxygenase-like lactoylglutathione lyase family enzyme
VSLPPPITGVLETVLYAADLPAAEQFYAGALGLQLISSSDRARGFRVNESAVLLVFDPALAASQAEAADVPPHGTSGPGHVALTVPSGTLDHWRPWLLSQQVSIELERGWERGGRSIYVRDPAGNSVELVEGAIWPP